MYEPSSHRAETLLRGDDVAARLNISRSAAFRLMQCGEIPVVRLGRSVRVHPTDLDRFIEERRRSGGDR